jgi:hypothetical protein
LLAICGSKSFRLQLREQHHVADAFLAGQSRAWLNCFASNGNRPGSETSGFRSKLRRANSQGNRPAADWNECRVGRNRQASRPKRHFSRSPCRFSNWNRPASGWNGRRSNRNGRASERKCGISMVTAIFPIGIGSIPTGITSVPAGIALFPAGTGLTGSEADGLGLELEFGDPEK